MSGGFDMGGTWSVRFPQHEGIKCYAILSGQCWLSVEGVAEPVQLATGDCFLLPQGRPFTLASDLTLTPADAYTMFPLPPHGAIRRVNGGGDCSGVGSYFAMAGTHAGLLLRMLPPIVHIQRESERAAMRWYLEQMMIELREPRPGGILLGQQLAFMMLVQALRLHLAEVPSAGVGWLFALANKEMSVALNAMHDAPGQRWTLRKLAERTGMSRSAFAQKFKATVGISALEYLTRWRMLLAGDRIATSNASISSLASALGYASESAFSTAFKRVMGCSPRGYRRGERHASPACQEMAASLPVLQPSTLSGAEVDHSFSWSIFS